MRKTRRGEVESRSREDPGQRQELWYNEHILMGNRHVKVLKIIFALLAVKRKVVFCSRTSEMWAEQWEWHVVPCPPPKNQAKNCFWRMCGWALSGKCGPLIHPEINQLCRHLLVCLSSCVWQSNKSLSSLIWRLATWCSKIDTERLFLGPCSRTLAYTVIYAFKKSHAVS